MFDHNNNMSRFAFAGMDAVMRPALKPSKTKKTRVFVVSQSPFGAPLTRGNYVFDSPLTGVYSLEVISVQIHSNSGPLIVPIDKSRLLFLHSNKLMQHVDKHTANIGFSIGAGTQSGVDVSDVIGYDVIAAAQGAQPYPSLNDELFFNDYAIINSFDWEIESLTAFTIPGAGDVTCEIVIDFNQWVAV